MTSRPRRARSPGSPGGAILLTFLLAACAGPPASRPPTPGPAPPPPAESVGELRRAQDEARTALERGDLAAASQALDVADALAPDQPATLFLRARFSEASADSDAALEYYRRAWGADPAPAHRDALVASLLDRAEVRFHSEDLEAAERMVSEAGSVDPGANLDRLRGLVAYARAERGGDDERAQHLAEAETSFRRALERSPEDAEAALDLASVLLASGRYPEAAALYRGLLVRDPDDGGIYLALARAQSLAGNEGEGEALEAAGRALRSGDPVGDPRNWAESGARRYPESELARTVAALGTPDRIQTYGVPGGGLVEAWFYRERGVVDVFRDGARVGARVVLSE